MPESETEMDQLLGTNLDSFFTDLAWDVRPDFQQAPVVTNLTTPTDQASPISSAAGRRESDSMAAPVKFQVCSSCRRKKRKCSLERPSCSLCRDNGWTCEYRSIKKKPGPAKGSVGLKASNVEERPKTGIAIAINEDAKRELINLYFTHVQPTYAMFCRSSFEKDLAENKISDTLLNAMFALASRSIPSSDISTLLRCSSATPWDSFARLAERQIRDQEDRNAHITLNDVKAVALLTLYEYTNFPGRRAWMMAGNMVRMAISIGLHRIDCDERRLPLSEFELEEHRFVWWTVWRLDSAINTLTGAPFGIEGDDICTALVSTPIADFTAGISTKSAQQFLSTDSERLWKSYQQLSRTDTDDGLDLYLLAVCHLRSVTTVRRRLYANPTSDLARQLTVLRNTLSCMRLSLPPWYFEPARQTLLETPDKHRLRLDTLLILYISHIHVLLPVTNTRLADHIQDNDLGNWKACISVGEEIAAIFHDWKPGYFAGADPMTSTIIWYTTSILTIHTMSPYGQFQETPDVRLVNALDLLILAMHNFAQRWQISRMLLDSLKELQIWAWVRVGLPEILSFVSQLRVPIDPMKQEPVSFDMWQIVEQADAVMEITEELQQAQAPPASSCPPGYPV